MLRCALLLCAWLWLAPALAACIPPNIDVDDIKKLLGDDGDKSLTWEAWWEAHAELFFGLARQPDSEQRAAGSRATLTGAVRREAIAALSRLLRGAKPSSVRMHAALALGKIGGPAERPALEQAVASDGSRVVRFVATLALGMLQDQGARDVLVRILDDERAHRLQRAYAAVALGFLGGSSFIAAHEVTPFLSRKLHPRADRGMQLGVLLGLGSIQTDEVVEQLERLLLDPHRHKLLRAAAAAALGRQDCARAVQALARGNSLPRDDKLVTQAVALALGQRRDPAAVGALRGLLAARDDLTGAFALLSLARQRDPAQTTLLIEKLDKVPSRLRAFAALALGVQGDPRAVPRLRRFVEQRARHESDHAAGVLALGLLRDRKMTPGLLQRIERVREPRHLAHAVTALGLAGDASVVPRLVALYRAQARHAPVRLAGTIALLKLESPAPFEVLPRDVRRHEQIEARRASAWAMGETADRRVAGELIALAGDEQADTELRVKATKALGHVLDKSRRWGTLKQLGFGFNYRAAALDVSLHNIFILP